MLSAKGTTQAELADSIGLSRSMFSSVVNGSGVLSFEWLQKACDTLGIEPTSVYSEKMIDAIYNKEPKRSVGEVVSIKLRHEYAQKVEYLKQRTNVESYTDAVKLAIDNMLAQEGA